MPIIIGGGLSGLSTAYYLTKKYANSKLKLTLLEATKRCGGWVKSTQNDDFIFEAGPRTIRPKGSIGVNTLNLIDDIGLSDSVIPIKSTHPAAKKRFVYAKNKLNMLPSSFMGVITAQPPFSKPLISALWHDVTSKAERDLEDDSMYNFVSRRLGKEYADYLISPMLCGICAGDAKEISVRFLFNHLFEMEQKHGGIVRGILKSPLPSKVKSASPTDVSEIAKKAVMENWSIYSLKGGLEQLPIKLSEKLTTLGVQMHSEHKIKEMSFYKNNEKVCVRTKDNYEFISEHVWSCIPAYELASLVKNNHPELSENLMEIPFVDVAVVNLQYDSDKLIKEDAFGFLVPPCEKLPILGVIYDSCCFTNQNGTVLTVMMGGKWFEEYFGKNPSKDDILDIAVNQVKNILDIEEKPSNYQVSILRKCIPQYIVGHQAKVRKIRDYIEKNQLPLSLCGASFDGVSVNDVIMSARTAVDNVTLV